MKNLIKISLITLIALNLNAQQAGLSEAQMNEVRAIMRQTQELVNERQDLSMGENIFNDKNKDINNQFQSNFKVNPLGMYGQGDQVQMPKFNNGNHPAMQNQNMITMEQPQELSKEELELMQNAIRNQDLKALQNKFHSKKYSGYENTQTIKYTPNKTHKIRTRHAMATTLIFDSNIDNFVLGDQTGFKIEQIPSKANAIAIIPQLIGIDTSLTIFTGDGKIHTFYIFSTDYKNSKDPSFLIYIQDDETKKVIEENKIDDSQYLIIKDGIAELKINKNDINRDFIQKALKENEWLVAQEIFSDKKFTYFKYSKEKMPQIPAIFAVIDRQDSPVETRIIGDYIIAETISPKFSIKSGESYVCVEKKVNLNTDKEAIKQRQKEHNKAIKEAKGI
ncbi:TPA: TrbG/VirB9 family P-type conjugative transfer protein [Campylobacter fetus subsp. venerealis]|uniref:P-type type IV conjugative transfer system translocation pore protein TrbG/VirB9 n=1 Tax=Campylobacter fetus subsp. venerealis NCTC 10354 TaxID=983328 RepID=A0AAE6J0K2_CAMFE|nr:TrbG/VirB9 family P-type conjugative transfer protein [Campylobacter fetus]OCS21825.1 type IV secretion system protein VirB9 [Campylobacter fetus subsp. venerealis cfvi97/532]OCS25260.1 type IV secretion system protein VirB9 [Campylobacter fetus subsp. venerealis cfvB10]OCS28703.1 type IV secretion system protein VirB9 [Campylobacter fetus subsp. venerealis LMG 6570 = CCUG 33900]AHE95055.1 type IV secretion system, translocation pore protein VirB9 [Campylobacter fetus subsp. venerealis cfvi0